MNKNLPDIFHYEVNAGRFDENVIHGDYKGVIHLEKDPFLDVNVLD